MIKEDKNVGNFAHCVINSFKASENKIYEWNKSAFKDSSCKKWNNNYQNKFPKIIRLRLKFKRLIKK